MTQNVNEENQIVVGQATQESNHMVTMMDTFTGRAVQFYSSVPDDGTVETKMKIYNAMNESDKKLADQLNLNVTLKDLIAYPIQLVSEQTGELVEAMRMVFIDEKGETYSSVSKGILGSVQNIIGLFGPAPWEPGITVTPVKKKTRSGFDTVVLRISAGQSK